MASVLSIKYGVAGATQAKPVGKSSLSPNAADSPRPSTSAPSAQESGNSDGLAVTLPLPGGAGKKGGLSLFPGGGASDKKRATALPSQLQQVSAFQKIEINQPNKGTLHPSAASPEFNGFAIQRNLRPSIIPEKEKLIGFVKDFSSLASPETSMYSVNSAITPQMRLQMLAEEAGADAGPYVQRLLKELQKAHSTCAKLKKQRDDLQQKEADFAAYRTRMNSEQQILHARINDMRSEMLKQRRHENHLLEQLRDHQEDGLIREFERDWEQKSLRCAKDLVGAFLAPAGAEREGIKKISDLEAKIKTLQAWKWEGKDAGVQVKRGRVVCDDWRQWSAMLYKRIWRSRVLQCFSIWHLEATTHHLGRLLGKDHHENHGLPHAHESHGLSHASHGSHGLSYGLSHAHPGSPGPHRAHQSHGGKSLGLSQSLPKPKSRPKGRGARIARQHMLVTKYDLFHSSAHDQMLLHLILSAWIQHRLQTAQSIADERRVEADRSVQRTQRNVTARVGHINERKRMEEMLTKAGMELAASQKMQADLQAQNEEMKLQIEEMKVKIQELETTSKEANMSVEEMLKFLEEAEEENMQLNERITIVNGELDALEIEVKTENQQALKLFRPADSETADLPEASVDMLTHKPGEDDDASVTRRSENPEPSSPKSAIKEADRSEERRSKKTTVVVEDSIEASTDLLDFQAASSAQISRPDQSITSSAPPRISTAKDVFKDGLGGLGGLDGFLSERVSKRSERVPGTSRSPSPGPLSPRFDRRDRLQQSRSPSPSPASPRFQNALTEPTEASFQKQISSRTRGPQFSRSKTNDAKDKRSCVTGTLARGIGIPGEAGPQGSRVNMRGRARQQALLRSQTARLNQTKGEEKKRRVKENGEEEEESEEEEEEPVKRFSVFDRAKYRKSMYAVKSKSGNLGGHSVGTQASVCLGNGQWSFFLHQLERKIAFTVLPSESSCQVSVFEIVEAWVLEKEFDLEVAWVLRDRKEAAQIVQNVWRYRQKKGKRLSCLPSRLMEVYDTEQKDAQLREERIARRKSLYHTALNKAGGKNANAGPPETVKTLLAWLHERHPDNHKIRQDPSYQTMSLNVLLEHSGARSQKLQVEARRLAELTNGTLRETKLQSRQKARAMARRHFGDNFRWLCGTVCASIVYSTVKDAYAALQLLLENESQGVSFRSHLPRSDFTVVEVQDHIHHPNSDDGEAYILVRVSVDGLITEIRLELEAVLTVTQQLENVPNAYESLHEAQEMLLVACMRGAGALATRIARAYKLRGTALADQNGRSAMHYCCIHGLTATILILSSNGGDVWIGDMSGSLPVEIALKNHHIDLLKVILRRMVHMPPASNADRRLRRFTEHAILWWVDHMSGSQPPSDEVAPLLAYATPEVREIWIEIGNLLFAVLRKWDKEGKEEGYLHKSLKAAAGAGQAPRVKALLMMGVQIWDAEHLSDAETALDMAITGRHRCTSACIKQFLGVERLSYGCNRPLLRPGLNQHLYQAALEEDLDYALAAMAAGASVNTAGTAGKTVLMTFAGTGSPTACKLLIDANADVCAEDGNGCRASQYALALGHPVVHTFLLQLEGRPPRQRFPPLGSFYGEVVRHGCASAILRYVSEIPEEMRTEMINRTMDRGSAPTGLLIATELACKNSEVQIVHDPKGQVCRALLHSQADPSIADNRGETPLHVAAKHDHMALYDQFYVALVKIHGDAKADEIVTTKKNQLGMTCIQIIEERERLDQTFRNAERNESRKVLRMIFAFWGTFRCALQSLSWRDTFDAQNAHLHSTRRRTMLDLIESQQFQQQNKKGKHHHHHHPKHPHPGSPHGSTPFKHHQTTPHHQTPPTPHAHHQRPGFPKAQTEKKPSSSTRLGKTQDFGAVKTEPAPANDAGSSSPSGKTNEFRKVATDPNDTAQLDQSENTNTSVSASEILRDLESVHHKAQAQESHHPAANHAPHHPHQQHSQHQHSHQPHTANRSHPLHHQPSNTHHHH